MILSRKEIGYGRFEDPGSTRFASFVGRATLAGMSGDGLQRRLGINGPTVAAVALGCSSMSGLTGAGHDDRTAAATVLAAVEQGVGLIDTADFYGLVLQLQLV